MASSTLYNLLNYRLRHYLITTSDTIKRQWHLAFLVVGVFYANWDFTPMASALSRLAAVATPRISDLVVLCLYQIAILLWVLLQRKALSGGDMGTYLKTLPISWSIQRNVESALVTLVTNLLWVPFLITMTFAVNGSQPSLNKAVCVINLLGLMLIQVLSTVRFLLNRESTIVFPLVAGIYLLVVSRLGIAPPYALTPAPLFLAAALLYCLPLGSRRSPFSRLQCVIEAISFRHPLRELLLRKPALAIQCHILFWEARVFTFARMIASVFFIFLAWYSIHFKQATDLAAYLLLIFSLFSSLTLSGLYKKLNLEHQGAREFLSTLPLPDHFWAKRDLILVGSLSAAIVFPFLLLSLGLSYIAAWQCAFIAALFVSSGILFRRLALVNQRFSMLCLWLAASALMGLGTWVLRDWVRL